MGATIPKRRLPLALLAVAVLLVAIASRGPWEPTRRAPAALPRPAPGPATDAAPATDVPRATAEAPPIPRERTVPRLPPRIEAHARRAVDRYVDEAGLADRVDEADRVALVTALGRVRDSSRWMQRHARAPAAAEARRRDAVLEAEHVFRETLGVGVSEFVAALSPPGTIEDLGAARQ